MPQTAALKEQEEEESQEEQRILCAGCRAHVCNQDLVWRPEGSVQAYANPQGHLRQIITVRRAWNLSFEAWATAEFTWFSGYAWRIAGCSTCQAHLGWRYEAESGQEPSVFFGLLTNAIARE